MSLERLKTMFYASGEKVCCVTQALQKTHWKRFLFQAPAEKWQLKPFFIQHVFIGCWVYYGNFTSVEELNIYHLKYIVFSSVGEEMQISLFTVSRSKVIAAGETIFHYVVSPCLIDLNLNLYSVLNNERCINN